MDVDNLLKMQKDLMEKVPHNVRPDVIPLMVKSVRIIETLLNYLGSCGHKPWRPIPLDPEVQKDRMEQFQLEAERFELLSELPASDRSIQADKKITRMITSSLGIIEETVEYITSINAKSRPEQLEEITDILFFYLEAIILGGFTPAEVEEEYKRKHAVNLKRYENGKMGDYSWDKRDEGVL